ncbi:hypothetical protein EJ02DRAFT_455493 [Clathrospora elynae]|uniref:WW domain-containing protein n=1 Tax=Clathrospora elynae TaxID=706981 RepID=A0A6A5SN27_9PLEO|nr:hypothetical protein EJ02DRAFT_455493 [Clathrospora elynae]
MAYEHSDKDEAAKPSPAGDAPLSDRARSLEQEQRPTTDRCGSYASSDDPPLPYDEEPPNEEDDGWNWKWDHNARAWYFFNTKTGRSQWENPRVPVATTYSHGSYDRNPAGSAAPLASSSGAPGTSSPPKRIWGGYNPAIHGSYDPNADYAREATKEEEEAEKAAAAAAAAAAGLPHRSSQDYAASAQFNRFTGKFQQGGQGPEMHNDENKSKRQMNAFFDVDAYANSHDGRSLKEERRNKTLNKKELKAFKDKRRGKKEEKRRGWLID